MASAGCVRKRSSSRSMSASAPLAALSGNRTVTSRSSMGIIGVSSSTVAKRKTVLSRAMDTVVIVASMNGKCTAALIT